MIQVPEITDGVEGMVRAYRDVMRPPAMRSFPKPCQRPNFYEYAPLDSLPPDTIRLLDLRPGIGGNGIKCGVFFARLTEQPKYSALSYMWGDSKESKLIN